MEIGRRHSTAKLSEHPYLLTGSSDKNFTSLDVIPWGSSIASVKSSRWSGNIDLLETAYFSMRSRIQPPEMDASRRTDNDLLRNRENWHQPQQRDEEQQNTSDQVGAFFDGLCKYARYSKFVVRGVLRNGEFNNSANVICSLSFSRDEDYFAAAGVSKKIKVFEFHGLLNDSVDIHYPAVEMSNRSRLSCVCWNSYIRNYLASTDYDGVVKVSKFFKNHFSLKSCVELRMYTTVTLQLCLAGRIPFMIIVICFLHCFSLLFNLYFCLLLFLFVY